MALRTRLSLLHHHHHLCPLRPLVRPFVCPLHTSLPLRRSPDDDDAQQAQQQRNPPSASPNTDFGGFNVLTDIPVPPTVVSSYSATRGFFFGNGVRVADGSGVILVADQILRWRPWLDGQDGQNGQSGLRDLVNPKGQLHIGPGAWGVFDLLWPRPDLLVVGTGSQLRPLSPDTKGHLSSLGFRIEVLDTPNAVSQYSLLATERGSDVAAAMLPLRTRPEANEKAIE